MKTKLFTLFVVLFATTNLWAIEFLYGIFRYEASAGYAELIGYDHQKQTSVAIPAQVSHDGIKYSVVAIGDHALSGYSSMTSITIPNSVTSIGKSILAGCSSLETIVVESGNTYYNSRENCNAIIETAQNKLIAGCRNTIIPNSVRSIGDYAFYGCSSLSSVTIPNSVTSIGDYAFASCSSLNSVTIPNSVTSIGDGAFKGCSSLKYIKIPDCVTNIGNAIFKGCSALTSITIPNNVTSIGYEAFYGCSSIRSITIPNSITSIGKNAFQDCSSLIITKYSGDVASWCDIKFGSCDANPISNSNNLYINNQKIKDLVIPNTVDSIRDYAFYGCSSLSSVTIPNSVKNIGEEVFQDCSSLITTKYSGDVASWCDIKFGSYNANPTSISHNLYINDQDIKDLIIPNTVDSIHEYAFYGCSSIISIQIPNSVKRIGEEAFAGFSSLTKVICNAVSAPSTEHRAFAYSPIGSTVLYVPDESIVIYKNRLPWKQFGSMLPISQLPTDVEDVQIFKEKDTSIKKVIRNGQVVILHNDKSYNIMGQEVAK